MLNKKININFNLLNLLLIFILLNFNISSTSKLENRKNFKNKIIGQARIIKTDQNQLDISPNDLCAYLEINFNNQKSNIIICKSGKIFKDIKSITGSSTGTPPHLLYKNYIGYYLPKSNKYKTMPGQARRITYCVGACN